MNSDGIDKNYEEAEKWLLKVKQKGKEEEVKKQCKNWKIEKRKIGEQRK